MLQLNKITSYRLSSELSDVMWQIVLKWDFLAKKTVGDQAIRSFDSIAANIAEGEGRHFKKDKMRFFYQARGSLYESIHWIEKAYARHLVTKEQYLHIVSELDKTKSQIQYLIAMIAKNLEK
jgi:four helix bundle protein